MAGIERVAACASAARQDFEALAHACRLEYRLCGRFAARPDARREDRSVVVDSPRAVLSVGWGRYCNNREEMLYHVFAGSRAVETGMLRVFGLLEAHMPWRWRNRRRAERAFCGRDSAPMRRFRQSSQQSADRMVQERT